MHITINSKYLIILNFIFSTNDYTVINNVQLDIAPALGPLNVKTVVIDKNDNAEGIVQFASETLTVKGKLGIIE